VKYRPNDEALAVLACDIELRPREAPSIFDIAKFAQSRERSPGAITVRFARDGSDAVASFVAAERTCCSTIGWDLVRDPAVILTITATPEQLDAIEGLLRSA
jgi:hypothetical protein